MVAWGVACAVVAPPAAEHARTHARVYGEAMRWLPPPRRGRGFLRSVMRPIHRGTLGDALPASAAGWECTCLQDKSVAKRSLWSPPQSCGRCVATGSSLVFG